MPKWLLALMTALLAAAFVSCGDEAKDEENTANLEDGTWVSDCRESSHGDDDDDDDSGQGDGGQGDGGDNMNQLRSLASSLLDGHEGDGGHDDPMYEKEQAQFSGGVFTYTSSEFSDAACATEVMSMVFSGDYVAGADAGETTVEGATALNISIATTNVTLRDADQVSQWASMCDGIAVDTAYDFSQCDFGDNGGDNGPKKGETWYTIFKATDTELFFGGGDAATKEGDTAANRVDGLETNAMKKQ